jgi:hypothetical protein
MILGRKSPAGEEPYYFGKLDGVDKKFRRVIAGVILPVFDRTEGAVCVIAETFSISRPQEFTVLDAYVGLWPDVERELLQYDKNFQFSDAIVPTKAERMLLWRIPWSAGIRTWQAPDWALTAVGHQKVDQLFKEGRLNADKLEAATTGDSLDLGSKALDVAVNYCLDWNPPYITKTPKPVESHPLGVKGL